MHSLHDFLVELHVLRLLFADHDWILQVEMNQSLNLLLGRLEERESDVIVHNVHLLVHFGAEISHTIRVRLQRARLATAATAERREHPQTRQAMHAARGENETLLANQIGALRALSFTLHDVTSQGLDLLHHVVGVTRVRAAKAHLLQKDGVRKSRRRRVLLYRRRP